MKSCVMIRADGKNVVFCPFKESSHEKLIKALTIGKQNGIAKQALEDAVPIGFNTKF